MIMDLIEIQNQVLDLYPCHESQPRQEFRELLLSLTFGDAGEVKCQGINEFCEKYLPKKEMISENN